MPLTFKHVRPNIEMDFEFKSAALTEMDGTARYKGREYHVIIGRKSVDHDAYGMLEIQQLGHTKAEAADGADWHGDHYDNVIPLPAELRSLDGDVVQIEDGVQAILASRFVQPWVFPDADGNYPASADYSMISLEAQLTTEQTDALFAALGVASWADTLAEQRNR